MTTTIRAAVVVAFFFPMVAHAGNYAKCLLKNLPGAENDVAAHAIMQVCAMDYPGWFGPVEQGSGRGWFGFKSGAECTAKKSVGTRSLRAARLISLACRRLYDDPVTDWDQGTITPPATSGQSFDYSEAVRLAPFTGNLDAEKKE